MAGKKGREGHPRWEGGGRHRRCAWASERLSVNREQMVKSCEKELGLIF